MFGGANKSGKMQKEIGRLDYATKQWSLAGSMLKISKRLNVIFDGEVFLVVGGCDNFACAIQSCTLSGHSMSCSYLSDSNGEPISAGKQYPTAWPELVLTNAKHGL